MKGIINIRGDIGTFDFGLEKVQGVELQDVIAQVKSQPQATSFDVIINSAGGSVKAGMDIYNYLKKIPVPVTTIGESMVASIATVIFMAGDIRKVHRGTMFMIHLPSGAVEGTSEEISQYNKMLQKIEGEMIDFYSSGLGVDRDTVKALLENETYLTEDQLISLGLVTEAPINLVARLSLDTEHLKFDKSNLKKSKKMSKSKKSILEQIKDLITGSDVKAKLLYDANNIEINFPSVDDAGDPQVGDEATVNGQPAEGEYIMPDGSVFTFSGGVLEAVTEAEPAPTLEQLESENATLKDELTTLKTQLQQTTSKVTDLETEKTALTTEITSLKGSLSKKEEILNKIKNFKPADEETVVGRKKPIKDVETNADADNRFAKAFANLKGTKMSKN